MLEQKMNVITDGGYSKIVYTLSENEHISKFANGMLVNNSIQGIMPYSVVEEKGVLKLIFNLNTGVRLSVLIKQNISKGNMLSIYRRIAEVLLDAEEYMLDAEGFILDTNHVFVDPNTLSVNLMYIPTNQRSGTSFNFLVKECMIDGVFDLADGAAYITQINNYFNTRPAFDLREFIRFINDLGSANSLPKQPVRTAQAAPQNQPRPQTAAQPAPQQPVKRAETPQQPVVTPPQNTPAPIKQTPVQPSAEAQPEKKHGFMHLFGKDKPKKQDKQPQPVHTMGGVAIPGVNAMPVSTPQPTPPPAPKPAQAAQQNAAPPQTAVSSPVSVPQPVQVQTPSQSAASDGNSDTIMYGLNQPKQQLGAYLTDQTGRRYEIQGNIFWIGRSKVSNVRNDLILSNGGVSKNHAYIEKINGKYYITDSNSQNGTFLNGKRLSSNVRTELPSGSKLRFCTDNFTFYFG